MVTAQWGGCTGCICKECLYYAEDKCMHGGCYDDSRMADDPCPCRGGAFYPVHECGKFTKYLGCRAADCLEGKVIIYQDGYVWCSIIDLIGCTECYRRFLTRMEAEA